ncbi:hypothetical protein K7432_017276 [Basidiobolus ranarum]|uniref:Uncharacterized protein n=1 Tax=Basidiobolus ranarum TaxID=34480 RepID=A0ABR2VKU2_9FUNG
MKGSLTKRTKIIIAVVTVIAVAAIAGGLGYHFTRKKDNQGGQNNGSKGAYTNPDIPINADLKIQSNSSYSRSFWGLAYTPLNVQYPGCGDTQDEVIEDLKILYQLTPRIRIYGV